MRLLLDSHAFIWWVNGNERLRPRARRLIADEANAVFVSAASAWEIATKYYRGRLEEASSIAPDIPGAIARQGFEELPVTVADGQRAGALPGPLRDPFDRMLIAQAVSRDLLLVSNEALFDQYGVHRLW
ncbi:MAG: type II toxin-antitoxin system VapC family toxin [Chloroflexi bacterium]|nr:type II toxin-antitoxin system VapC family toxin [Chloroflexota bacterium]